MKIISWNCQGAFRKKADVILNYRPDLLIIEECEHPDKIFSTLNRPNDFYWYSDFAHKGVGIFSFSDCRFELLNIFNPEFKYVLPFKVWGFGQTFTLFAIWAMNNKENYEARYIGQIWLAINYYADLLGNSTILIGDFNSNKIWDYKDRVGNHSDVVRKLADNNIHSIYHKHFNFEQGKEGHPTFFQNRNRNRPYHIDYCFVSSDLSEKVKNIEIGPYEDWSKYSDHSPLIIDFVL